MLHAGVTTLRRHVRLLVPEQPSDRSHLVREEVDHVVEAEDADELVVTACHHETPCGGFGHPQDRLLDRHIFIDGP
jgi:hypothetical protein